jgi:hypothetical protein
VPMPLHGLAKTIGATLRGPRCPKNPFGNPTAQISVVGEDGTSTFAASLWSTRMGPSLT